MTDHFDQEFKDYRDEFDQEQAREWYARKVTEAEEQLTEAEREQARRMGMSALSYLRGKEGGPLTGDAVAEAQREQARKMGVELDADFDRPIAWWHSAGAEKAALARARERGPAAAAALATAIVENQRRISRGLEPNVRIPPEALGEVGKGTAVPGGAELVAAIRALDEAKKGGP